MTARPAPPRPRPAIGALAAFIVAGLAGCSPTTPPPHPAPTVPTASAGTASGRPHPVPGPPGGPDVAAVNGADATAVSRTALVLMWTIDYSADHDGPRDAQLRALPLLTPAYAATVRAAPPGPPPPDAWITGHARTRVRLRPGTEDRPADTATTAYRQWLLTVTTIEPPAHHGARPALITAHVTAYVILTRPAGGPADRPWRIAGISTY